MLYIDDFVDSLQFLSGSQLVALPYAYSVWPRGGEPLQPTARVGFAPHTPPRGDAAKAAAPRLG